MSYFILTIRAAVFKQVWTGLWGQGFLRHILLGLITPLLERVWGGSGGWGHSPPFPSTPESSRTLNFLALFHSKSTLPQEERQVGFQSHHLPYSEGQWDAFRSQDHMLPFPSLHRRLITWEATNHINALQPLRSFFFFFSLKLALQEEMRPLQMVSL